MTWFRIYLQAVSVAMFFCAMQIENEVASALYIIAGYVFLTCAIAQGRR